MSHLIEIICAFPLVAAGLASFVYAIRAPRRIGLLGMSLIFYTLQFGVGPLLFSPLSTERYQPIDVISTWLVVYLFWGSAFALAAVWRSSMPPIPFADDYQGTKTPRGFLATVVAASLQVRVSYLILAYLIVTAFRAFLQLRYGIVLSGGASEQAWNETPYAVLAMNQVFCFAGVGIAMAAMARLVYQMPGRIWALGLILAESVFMFTQGRRWIFSFALTLVLIYLVPRKSMRMRHAVVGVILAVLLLQVVFPFFFLMRQHWQNEPNASVVQWVQGTAQQMIQGTDRSEDAKMNRSMHSRLRRMSAGYIQADAIRHGVPTFGGRQLVSGMLSIIPSVVFPDKYQYVVLTDQSLNQRFQIKPHAGKNVDLTTQIPLIGQADFGVLGGLVYGVLFLALLRLFEWIYVNCLSRNYILAMMMLGVFAMTLVMQMENTVGGAFEVLRAVVIYWLVAVVLGFAAGKRPQMAPAAQAGHRSLWGQRGA